jgi:hypothetical protein
VSHHLVASGIEIPAEPHLQGVLCRRIGGIETKGNEQSLCLLDIREFRDGENPVKHCALSYPGKSKKIGLRVIIRIYDSRQFLLKSWIGDIRVVFSCREENPELTPKFPV